MLLCRLAAEVECMSLIESKDVLKGNISVTNLDKVARNSHDADQLQSTTGDTRSWTALTIVSLPAPMLLDTGR